MDAESIYENWRTTPQDFKHDIIKFLSWFDTTNSIEATIAQAHIDLHSKIILPDVYKVLGDIKKKKCLEIGFGGGRLVHAASRVFSSVVGIDIHSCFDITDRFLKDQGTKNYSLLHVNEVDKVGNESIDFVFSFIVFQHFGKIDFFYSYLDLIQRVLSKNGCCNIHFGKNKWNNQDFFLKTDIQEKTGYSTMFYNPEFVKRALDERGFVIVSEGQVTKMPWVNDLSGQFYVIFKKKQE